MAVYTNQQGIPVIKDALGNAWASVAASTAVQYQLIGFSGTTEYVHGFVEVKKGSTTIYKGYVGSSHPLSEVFGTDGPVTATNESLSVHTQNKGSAATACTANLLYRIVL